MDLCIDIGATKTFVAAFNEDSLEICDYEQFLTESSKGFSDFLERLSLVCKRLLKQDKPRFWGVCTAGAVDENGVILWSPNLGWKDFDLKNSLSVIFGDNGIIENDCNAAAYAEARIRQSENLAYVTVSTGIGMGLIIKGEIFHGSHFTAGEIGHTIIEEDGPICSCGRRGCLQALSSGRGLENQIYSLLKQKLSCEEILKRAEEGIEPYRGIVLHGAKVLGRFLTNVVDILDLETLVIGGGLTKNKFYTNLVVEYIQKNYYELPGKIVSVELSKIKPNPGVIGVLLLGRKIFGGV
ncbi:ROK family protein [Thermotoga profunda]|uniref:ROK family protein n=1 Tax=Thermotoga profunda TaxID=1508420 RepID=UPI0006950D5E|nr:ROK family protein [Thermotoga profunda]